MVLQVITPVVKGGQERAPEKKDDFLDILLKGLKAAESATGIGVNVEKLRTLSQEREEKAARIKGEKDIEAGIASPEARRAHIMAGGKIVEATAGGTLTEELRRLESKEGAKETQSEPKGLEELILGVQTAKEPEEKEKQQEILDEYLAAIKKHNITDEDFQEAELEYGNDGKVYAVIKKAAPLQPMTALETDLLDPTTGEIFQKGGPERQKELDLQAQEETRARDEARVLRVPIGWQPGKDPDDPRQFLRDTDVLLRDGNKQVVLRDFAPRVLLKERIAQAEAKHKLPKGSISSLLNQAMDKKNALVKDVQGELKNIRELATGAYKEYETIVRIPNTGVGHVALIFKTIRNLDDKTGVKQGDMQILFRGLRGDFPVALSPDQISILKRFQGELQNKYGITEKDLKGIKLTEIDANGVERPSAEGEAKLKALIMSRMGKGQKFKRGFLPSQTVKDLRELNKTLYQAARERYRKEIEPRINDIKNDFEVRVRGLTNDESLVQLVVEKLTPSLDSIPGIVEDKQLLELESKYPGLVTEKELESVVGDATKEGQKDLTEDEQKLLDVYREEQKRNKAKAQGTGTTRGQQENERFKQWRLEQKEMGLL